MNAAIEPSSAERPMLAEVDLHERIRRRACELWEQGGREHGHDREHWLQAEPGAFGGGQTEKSAA